MYRMEKMRPFWSRGDLTPVCIKKMKRSACVQAGQESVGTRANLENHTQ